MWKRQTRDWEQRKLGDIVERVTRKNQDLVSNLPLTISAQYGLIDQNNSLISVWQAKMFVDTDYYNGCIFYC